MEGAAHGKKPDRSLDATGGIQGSAIDLSAMPNYDDSPHEGNGALASLHALLDIDSSWARRPPRLLNGLRDDDPRWHVRSAPEGTGSVLIRRWRAVEGLVPPGVLARSTPNDDAPLTYHGWRHLRWADNDVRRCVSGERPISAQPLSLQEVVGAVRADMPEHEAWVRFQVGEEIARFVRLLRPLGGLPPAAERSAKVRSRLVALVLDATPLFGEPWVLRALGDWGHLLASGAAWPRPTACASWPESLVGPERAAELAMFLARQPRPARRSPLDRRRDSASKPIEEVRRLLDRSLFLLDHRRARHAIAEWGRLLSAWKPTAAAELYFLVDAARIVVQSQAELVGDTHAALHSARRVRQTVVQATRSGTASLSVRASGAAVMASALFVNSRWNDCRSWARLAERLTACDASNEALAPARRARALHIAAIRQLIVQGRADHDELRSLVTGASSLIDARPARDPFDRRGLNQLASQVFYACVDLGDYATARDWFSHALVARTDLPRHQVTRPLLEAGICRVEGAGLWASSVEASTRSCLRAIGLQRVSLESDRDGR